MEDDYLVVRPRYDNGEKTGTDITVKWNYDTNNFEIKQAHSDDLMRQI
jgi:hypothetical protein